MQGRGKAFWHCTGLIVICLGTKGINLSDIVRNKSETIKE